jgi:hypothetical protein
MRYFVLLIFLIVIIPGCKQKILKGADLENKLVETMQQYLEKQAKPGVHFQVKNVIYFPEAEKKFYRCEFQVAMHTDNNNADTIGMMAANISNDFTKVDRKQ